jgi:hypothetical protein
LPVTPQVEEDSGLPQDLGDDDLSIDAQEAMEIVMGVLETDPFDPSQIEAAYLDLLSQGDPDCPGSGTDLTGLVPVEGCTSANGLTYLGVSTYFDMEEEIPDGGSRSGFVLSGDFEIVDAEGQALIGGGFATIAKEEFGADAPMLGVMGISGTWRYPAAEGALGQGISGAYWANIVVEDGAFILLIEGALGVGEGAIYFDELVYGEGCPTGLAGAIEVRSPEGRWVRIEMGEDCDLCGQASGVFSGEPMGEACMADSAAMDRIVAVLWP